MPGRRQERREERREDRQTFGRRGSANRYQMRQKMIAIGDDFWIENEQGQRVYKVDGKALRIRETLNFEDAQGNLLCKIQERMMRIKDSMEVEDANGEQIAMVKKALISPIRDRFVVKIKNGPDLDVKGNILDHEYTIGEGRDKIAEVSKKWFRIRDSYGVEIEPGQDDIVILAVAVCIDQMAHGRH
ncbi:MAG: LURP-one-related family protein [Caldilineales bacterium]|nr:LURP-one-related family protein [Caldilineales bacterium]